MRAIEQQLRDFMVENDVPADVAQRAAAECAHRLTTNFKTGAVAGLAVGLATANPGALIMGLATGAGAGAATLLGSPSCEQVRDVAFRIAASPFTSR